MNWYKEFFLFYFDGAQSSSFFACRYNIDRRFILIPQGGNIRFPVNLFCPGLGENVPFWGEVAYEYEYGIKYLKILVRRKTNMFTFAVRKNKEKYGKN